MHELVVHVYLVMVCMGACAIGCDTNDAKDEYSKCFADSECDSGLVCRPESPQAEDMQCLIPGGGTDYWDGCLTNNDCVDEYLCVSVYYNKYKEELFVGRACSRGEVGDFCDPGVGCNSGLICSSVTKDSNLSSFNVTYFYCRVPFFIEEGDHCYQTDECVEGLTCRYEYTCESDPASLLCMEPVGVGGACCQSSDCQTGLTCTGAPTDEHWDGTCQPNVID